MKKNNVPPVKKTQDPDEINIDIVERFGKRTFEEKVDIFTKLRQHMREQFEQQYKAHEEKAAWLKNAYEHLVKQ